MRNKGTIHKIKALFCPWGYWSTEDIFYIIGWVVLLLFMALGAFYMAAPELASKIFLPCPVHFLTGLYCPGCGGTRAVLYLLRGNIKSSLIHHPAVLYMAISGAVFMGSQTISRITWGRTWAMRIRAVHIYILAGLYIFNFLWKNIALLMFHVRIIA